MRKHPRSLDFKYGVLSRGSSHNPSVEATSNLLEKLKSFPVSCAWVEETSIEVTPLGITKGAGLESLSSYLNIPIENTVMMEQK